MQVYWTSYLYCQRTGIFSQKWLSHPICPPVTFDPILIVDFVKCDPTLAVTKFGENRCENKGEMATFSYFVRPPIYPLNDLEPKIWVYPLITTDS